MIDGFSMKEMRKFVGIATEMSYRPGARRGMGRLVRWSVMACWESEDSGFAYLVSSGWRGADADRARLRVLEGADSTRLLTTYDMDFSANRTNVYHAMVEGARVLDIMKLEGMQFVERTVGLAVMRPEEAETLRAELIRGAAGKYSLAAQ